MSRRRRRRRIEETLISVLPQELLFEIFSFAENEELQSTIPFVCKEFREVLECAIKSKIIKRKCEYCNKEAGIRFGEFGLKKTLCPPKQVKNLTGDCQKLFVCVRCRRKCDRCKNWTYLFENEEQCSDCRRVVCLECKPWCTGCGDRKKCYDCIKKMETGVFDRWNYYCQDGC